MQFVNCDNKNVFVIKGIFIEVSLAEKFVPNKEIELDDLTISIEGKEEIFFCCVFYNSVVILLMLNFATVAPQLVRGLIY